MKRPTFYEDARRLFVEHNLTFAEIAKRMGVSAKTIANWATEDKKRRQGQSWHEARLEFLKKDGSLHEQLYDLAVILTNDISDKLRSKDKKVDSSEAYLLKSILDKLPSTKKYEDVVGEEKANLNSDPDQKPDPTELMRKIKTIIMEGG